MNSSNSSSRRPRTPTLAPEQLEDRKLMTGGVGDTFAIMPAKIATANGHTSVSFNLDPKLFTDPGNKPFLLGIDVAANSGSTANPTVRSVTTPNGKILPVTHASFDMKVTRTGTGSNSTVSSAALVTIPGLTTKTVTAAAKGKPAKAQATPSYTYKVNIDALDKTSGTILVGFYLPGDASGTGSVNQAGINAIKYGLNTTANDTTGKYSFDADVNRNGKIDQTDLNLAQKNFGVGTTVSPVISANLDPSTVSDAKNRVTNVPTAIITGTATPGSTISYAEGTVAPTSTIADVAGNYKINLNLVPGANVFSVMTTDAFNQKITGSIASITYTKV